MKDPSEDHSSEVEGPLDGTIDGGGGEGGSLDNGPINRLSRLNSSDSCRLSQQVSSEMESESEEEPVKNEFPFADIVAPKPVPQRCKFRKRSSFCGSPWVIKMVDKFNWMAPYENYALQVRYAVAGVLVALALGILSSSFLSPSAS